jgi:hypothetical protein
MAYLYVNPDGVTRPYSTVTEAIDAASPGDVIVLDPGVYTEHVILNKHVSLKGNTEHPENDDIIIQPPSEPSNYVVLLNYSSNPSHITFYIEGITLRMNSDVDHEYVLLIQTTAGVSYDTSLVLSRCRLINIRNGHSSRIIHQNFQYINNWWFDHCDLLFEGAGGTNWHWNHTRLEGESVNSAKVIACRYDRTPTMQDTAGSFGVNNYVVSTTTVSGYGPGYTSDWYIPLATGYFDGYVTEEGSPVQRTINFYNRATGALTDTTTSDPSTGYYYMGTTSSGMHYIVCLDDPADPLQNDLIIGSTYPTAL